MVCDTPPSQDVSTHKVWNSYLKEYRRYGPDTKAGRTDGLTDGRTDSAITICLPKFLWGVQKNLTSIKGHNSVTNKQKVTGKNPNLDIVNYIKAYTKFGKILSICFPDIEWKKILT